MLFLSYSSFIAQLTIFWWIIPILITIGLIFSIVEAFIPGFGVFGIFGIISFLLGVVYYALIADAIWKVVVLVLAIFLFVIALFLIIVRSAKYGSLGRTSLIENKTVLPIDYDLKDMMYNSKYLNKFGKIEMDCRPVGKMRIDGELITVYSRRGVIEKGTVVKVMGVDDDKIIVDVEE